MDNMKLNNSLKDNVDIFKKIFLNDETIIYRYFSSQKVDNLKCCIIFIDNMANKEVINENIILPIINCKIDVDNLDVMVEKVIYTGDIKKVTDVNILVRSVLYGSIILLTEGLQEALLIGAIGWNQRTITEPLTEKIVSGPREGFTESIHTNLSLIRRKILSENLKFKFQEIGTITKTKVSICYIEGLVSEKIIKELNDRLLQINMDGILDSGYIEDLIKDSPLSPFKTIGSTERPDVVAGKLLEGRVALVCDGTPVVLTMPFTFVEYFQTSEDYYKSYVFSSINRILRIFGFFLSTSVPAIYIALSTLHQEMIPSPLLLSISASREGLPFPTLVEALIMLLVFEIIREAGTRLPAVTGQAISIVGALVLGEAAVGARIISAPMVIIVALTGITSFLTPNMIEVLILIRVVFLIFSAAFGLYGYIFVLIALFIHLMAIRSFGVPYMIYINSIYDENIKDTAIRAPWLYMHYRPKLIGSKNPMRRPKKARKEST